MSCPVLGLRRWEIASLQTPLPLTTGVVGEAAVGRVAAWPLLGEDEEDEESSQEEVSAPAVVAKTARR